MKKQNCSNWRFFYSSIPKRKEQPASLFVMELKTTKFKIYFYSSTVPLTKALQNYRSNLYDMKTIKLYEK